VWRGRMPEVGGFLPNAGRRETSSHQFRLPACHDSLPMVTDISGEWIEPPSSSAVYLLQRRLAYLTR